MTHARELAKRRGLLLLRAVHYKIANKQANSDKITSTITAVERIRLNAPLVMYFRIQNCR
jgi:hypothetical protein